MATASVAGAHPRLMAPLAELSRTRDTGRPPLSSKRKPLRQLLLQRKDRRERQSLLILTARGGLLLSGASGGKKPADFCLKFSAVERVIKIVGHRGRRIMNKQLWVGRSATAKAPSARQ
jgi:hypothetical protein